MVSLNYALKWGMIPLILLLFRQIPLDLHINESGLSLNLNT